MRDQKKLLDRVINAARAALKDQGYVSAVDVFCGIGWLDPSTLKRWQQGQVPHLEAGMQTSTARITEAMEIFHAWATAESLAPSETAYVAKNPSRAALRFSASGDESTERRYRTHWMSRDLSERARERIEAKANRPPELVVIQPRDEWKCHRCAGTGDVLIMEAAGPSCLACAGLGALVFLPSGDAGVSRRAKAASKQYAVVVRWSTSRKRYERQGLMVEPAALKAAEKK